MPTQTITLEISTEPIPEEQRADLAQELLRALNGLVGAYLPDRDGMHGEVVKWEAK